MKARKILSVIMAIAMIAAFAVSASATDTTVSESLSYAEFSEAIRSAEGGVYDGKNVTVVLKDSERSYQNNKTAQFFIGATDVNITDPVETVRVSNVNFVFEDDDTANTYTSGELQVFAKVIEFTGCTFEGVAVSPWGMSNADNAESATFTNCTWKNLSGRYGVHQNRASALTVTGCTFENCERGIHTNSSTVTSIVITNNTFTGIGDSYGVICLAESNGDLSQATLNISGNTAEGQVMLRQLSETVTYEQVSAILNAGNNTYGTAYVTGSVEPSPAATPVAKIGNTEYTDLQTAIDEAETGDTVTLLSNVEMGEVTAVTNFDGVVATSIKDLVTALYIPAGKSIVLDLNGKSLSGYATNASIGSGFVAPDVYKNYAMIVNDGALTIKDSLSGGKISYTDLNSDVNNYYSLSTTILNGGTLIMESGRVENLSEGSSVCPAIDNSSFWSNPALRSPVLTINDGELYSKNYYAVRAYTHYEDAADKLTNTLTVNGGSIGGYSGIYGQVGDLWATRDVTLKLTINNGDIYAADGNSAFRIFLANPDNTGLELAINGGNFTGAIRADVNFGYGNTTGGSTDAGSANAYWLGKTGGFITGGTFSTISMTDDPYGRYNVASFVKDGYELTANSNGTYGVVKEATKDDIFGEQTAYISDITYQQDEKDFYSVILLAGIDSLNYREVGFKVTVDGTTEERGTNTVYTSILASDTNGDKITVTPGNFGTKVNYIFGQRYEFNGEFKTSALTFCPYAIDTNGNYIYGEEATIEKIYSK